MKKILILLTLIMLTFSTIAVANDVVTTRKRNVSPSVENLTDKLKICSPYSESLNSEFSGIKMDFNIKIAGWVNDKCRIDFVANYDGIASSFDSIFGISSSQSSVYAFAPKVRCEFTKQQLAMVGDSILQENDRANGGKMLKNPNEINYSSASAQDVVLLDVVFNQNACKILNQDSLNSIMNLFQ